MAGLEKLTLADLDMYTFRLIYTSAIMSWEEGLNDRRRDEMQTV